MKKRAAIIIILSVFAIAWLLGVLRFESEIALVAFKTLMFPFGFIYLALESYISTLQPTHILQNEFLPIGIFCILIMLQALLYVYVLNIFFKKKTAK